MSFKLTLGRTGIAGMDLFTNEAIAAFYPRSSELDPRWLYYALPSIITTGTAEQAIKGQTLNKDNLQRLLFRLPSPGEQHRIAEILDIVDKTIRRSEALIAKLKQMKAGLLRDLLTRGIDEQGQLRDPAAHPERFKGSALGYIPQEWQVQPVSNLFEVQLGKMLSKAAKTGQHAFPYLANRNVQWDRTDLTDLEWMDFSEAERDKYALRPGDLLVCEGGEVGRTAMWHGEIENCYFQKAIHRLRPIAMRILPGFMLRFMHRAVEYGLLTSFTSQTSIAHFTQEKLALLPVAVPPLKEQCVIADIFDAHDARIGVEEAYRDKLKLQKKGLMDDLLTGRVRVGAP